MLRILRIFLEIVAGLVGIVVVLGLILIWRLNQGPIRSAILTPYLEAGIESNIPGTQVEILHTLLTWNNDNRVAALHADGLRIFDNANGTNELIGEIPSLDIQLSAIGILFGQFLPTELVIDHPQFKVEREEDGTFTFGDISTGNSSSGSGNKQRTDMKRSLARATRHLAHGYFTNKLIVSHAVFDVHDISTKSDWSVRVPDISLKRSEGALIGQLVIDIAQKDKTSTLEVHYAYDRKKSLHKLVTRFNDVTPAFFAGGHPATLGLAEAATLNLPLTGEVNLALDDRLDIAAGSMQLHGDSGTLFNTDLWDQPRKVKSLDIKGSYDRQEGALDIPTAAIDFGGPHVTLTASGSSGLHLLNPHSMDIELNVTLDNWPMDQYGQLWPKPIITNARDWIAVNLSKGNFDHGEGKFKAVMSLDDPSNIVFKDGKGKVQASGGDVKYVDGMPAVRGVSAEGDFDLSHMTVNIKSGGIGDIRLLPFTILLSGFEDKIQKIEIPLKVSGPVPSILSLIDNPPLGYTKAVGLKPDDITGRAEGVVNFHLPLLKSLEMKDIDVNANTDLFDVASSKLVDGIDISQGNMTLALDTKSFVIKGQAALNGLPFQIAVNQHFDPQKNPPLREVKLTGNLTADQFQASGINLFNGTKGMIGLELSLMQPDKTKMAMTGTLDMTSAETHIDQLNWKKPAGASAAVKVIAEKLDDKQILVKSIEAHGPQMNISGDAIFSAADSELLSLNLNPMVVGRTNARLHYSGMSGPKNILHFDAEGQAFDVSGLRGGKDPEHADPRLKEFHIEVGKLYSSPTGFIENAKGYARRDTHGWSEISLHGLADGGHKLDIDLAKKADGNRTFTLSCDDFGKALKGLGFTDTVRDGNLYIYGESEPDDPRVIAGTASIGHFSVGHLPALAVLMNAASPFGFTGLFTDSMDFDNLKGRFRWDNDDVKLTGVHAAGASVGININGHADLSSGEANLHGTMVPFSVMNGMINEIPVLGDLITGGKGQGIFAVSYSITGSLGDPHISVNPVSLLTPGFLRNLFFDESDDDEPSEKKPPSP